MRTITYGPESNPEGIISMFMKGPVMGKDAKEQFKLLLVKDFTWSQQTAMALRTCLNGKNVVAIVDIGCSGVVVSESCFRRLKLAHNREIEFTITLATDTNQNNKRIMKKLEVKVGNSKVVVPAIVLEGLHFDVLLIMSWLRAAEANIDVVNESIRIQGEQIPYKAWPEPASFLAEDGVKLYCKELAVIAKGEPKMVEVYH